MKWSPLRVIVLIFTVPGGMVFFCLGFLANLLGIDNDPGWGPMRITAAIIATFLLLVAAATIYWRQLSRSFRALDGRSQAVFAPLRLRWAKLVQTKFVRGIVTAIRWVAGHVQRLPGYRALFGSPDRTACAWAFIIACLGIFFTIWFATAGKMTVWPEGTNYFDQQAEAFLHGQTALLAKPDPQLAALANPYDYETRGDIPIIWDTSYYQGKYYLYWGPTPALIAAAIKLFGGAIVSDLALVIFFEIGLLINSSLVILALRRKFFPTLPGWTVIPPLFAALFANPIYYILNRPSVYEAAITGGQFFLILGLFFALHSLDEQRRTWSLVLASVCWALAVCARLNLVLAVAGLALTFAWQSMRRARIKPIVSLASIFVPLMVGAVLLGTYNLARFGSPFETGHRYQLTGLALPSDYSQISSPAYIIPNLYSYFIRPIYLQNSFPFVLAPWIKEDMWPFYIKFPSTYSYAEPVTGVLTGVPFVWLGLLVIPLLLRPAWPVLIGGHPLRSLFEDYRNSEHKRFHEFLLWMTVSVLLAICADSIFIGTTMRYELDFLPLMIFLSGVSFFASYKALGNHPLLRKGLVLLVILLALATMAVGLCLGFTGYSYQFENLNPGLYQDLKNLFIH